MKKKLLLLVIAVLAVATLIGGGVSAAIVQSRNVSLAIQAGDSEIVAKVDGIPVTMGSVRIATESAMNNDTKVTNKNALKMALNAIFETKAAIAEAQRLGINASSEGYAMYMEAKSLCEDPEIGEPCRQFIEDRGYSQEEFWENALPLYIEEASIAKLSWIVVENSGLGNASYEEQGRAWAQYKVELRNNAQIEWQNQMLRYMYLSQ